MSRLSITPRRLCLAAAALSTAAAVLTGIAHGDDGTATVLGPFNLTDSHGLKISQYQLSINQGGVTDFGTSLQAQVLIGVWDSYRMLIGLIAYIADWVTAMSWVTWITGPINAAATSIHQQLLVPLHLDQLGTTGLMGLLVTTAGAIIVIHLIRGHTSRALSETLLSAAIAAAVVGALAAPVLTFAGNDTEPAAPLRVAQRIGLDISNLILDKPLSATPIDATLQPGQPAAAETVQPVSTGGLLVDTFIRPVHQLVNYGTVLDTTDSRCAQVYDTTLKAGPYNDPDKARTQLGRCDKHLGDYADSSSWLRVVGLNLYVATAGLLALLVLAFAALLMFAVITLSWASLKLIIHAPLAIIPGDSRGPSIRDLVDIAISLCYVVTGIAALSVVIRMVDATLTNTSTVPLQVRFIGIDLLLIAGVALLIVNYVAHRRGVRTVGERIMARLRQTPPRTTAGIGQKTAQWLAQPSFAAMSPAAYGYGAGLVGGPAAMRNGSRLARRPLNRVTASNGVQLALAAGSIAVGGAGLGIKTLTATGKLAHGAGRVGYHTGRAGTRVAIHAAHETSKAWRVHQHLRAGAQHATTGHPRIDQALSHSARAHQHLADAAARTAAATTTRIVLGAGPRPDTRPPARRPASTAPSAQSRADRGQQGRRTPGTPVTPHPKTPRLTDPSGSASGRPGTRPPAATGGGISRPRPGTVRNLQDPTVTVPLPRPAPSRRPAAQGADRTTGVKRPT